MRSYASLDTRDLTTLRMSALRRLNIIFSNSELPTIPSALIFGLPNITYPTSIRKWWLMFRRKMNAHPEKTVFNEYLCRSVKYASVSVPSQPHKRIPIIVYECVHRIKNFGLDKLGLFRVSGAEKRITQLEAIFDKGPDYGLGCALEPYSIPDVTDVLKRYLRSLPVPVLTTELYPFFIQCLNIQSLENKIHALRLMLMLIPPAHLYLFEYLLDLFHLIDELHTLNQMGPHNLGLVLAPNLLFNMKTKASVDSYEKSAKLLEFMIHHHEQFIISSGHLNIDDALEKPVLPLIRKSSTMDMERWVEFSAYGVVVRDDANSSVSERLKRESEVVIRHNMDEVFQKTASDQRLARSGTGPSPQTKAPGLRRVRTAPTKRVRHYSEENTYDRVHSSTSGNLDQSGDIIEHVAKVRSKTMGLP